jgi:hypothetical protein
MGLIELNSLSEIEAGQEGGSAAFMPLQATLRFVVPEFAAFLRHQTVKRHESRAPAASSGL